MPLTGDECCGTEGPRPWRRGQGLGRVRPVPDSPWDDIDTLARADVLEGFSGQSDGGGGGDPEVVDDDRGEDAPLPWNPSNEIKSTPASPPSSTSSRTRPAGIFTPIGIFQSVASGVPQLELQVFGGRQVAVPARAPELLLEADAPEGGLLLGRVGRQVSPSPAVAWCPR